MVQKIQENNVPRSYTVKSRFEVKPKKKAEFYNNIGKKCKVKFLAVFKVLIEISPGFQVRSVGWTKNAWHSTKRVSGAVRVIEPLIEKETNDENETKWLNKSKPSVKKVAILLKRSSLITTNGCFPLIQFEHFDFSFFFSSFLHSATKKHVQKVKRPNSSAKKKKRKK